MRDEAKNSPAEETDDSRMEKQKEKAALSLAKRDVDGPGLVTRMGLTGLQSNEEELRNGLKMFLKENHPDKNPNADLARVQDATDLLNLIKDGNFKLYLDELEKRRASA